MDRRKKAIITASKKRQFLVQERGDLPLKAEKRGAFRPKRPFITGAVGDGRVLGIRVSFISQNHVEVMDPTRSQQESIVGWIEAITRADTQADAALENRLINFDQPVIV